MSRIAFVDGAYVRHGDAAVSIDDRGFQFADSVYEVVAVVGGAFLDEKPHLDRLERSLRELRQPMPMGRAALSMHMREVVRRNRVRDGIVYLQVTRGVARRDHGFPTGPARPTLVITARSIDMARAGAAAETGVAVRTVPENRWGRCDIKTTGLLPNVLAKQAARDAGAYEAWFVDAQGYVTEGASTNAWIVTADGRLATRALTDNILAGVTRAGVAAAAQEAGVALEERPFSLAEALTAREAFITAATSFVLPVVAIDGERVGEGAPGPMARRLRALYLERAKAI